jgi:hypothetical protein
MVQPIRAQSKRAQSERMSEAETRGASRSACDISVLVITYNHERYIGAALESVLAQSTRRRFEVLVSEDRSTDGTFAIVEDYARRHNRIRVVRSERNLKSNEVVARAVLGARGRYVCMLDGDDYWLGDRRLEAQADRLDADPDISAVFHNALVIEGDAAPSDRLWTPPDQAPLTPLEQLWEGNPFASCAGMMRREALSPVGRWYHAFFPITDWPLYILCAQRAPIAFENVVAGAYRLHGGGLFSALTARAKLDQIEDFYRRMRRAPAGGPAQFARAGRTRYFFNSAAEYARQGHLELARDCLFRAFRGGGLGRDVSARASLALARRLWTASSTQRARA